MFGLALANPKYPFIEARNFYFYLKLFFEAKTTVSFLPQKRIWVGITPTQTHHNKLMDVCDERKEGK